MKTKYLTFHCHLDHVNDIVSGSTCTIIKEQRISLMNDLSNLIKPKSLRQHLYFLGPGLLLAVAAAGESGITEAIGVGAHFGFSLIWVV